MWKITLENDRLVFTPFFDEEPKKVSVSTLYGEMVMDKVRDKFWTENFIGKQKDQIHDLKEKNQRLEMDLQNRDEELHDLKLENDRLQQREELYQKYLIMFDCLDRSCNRCTQYRPSVFVPCKLALPMERHNVINALKKELEDL